MFFYLLNFTDHSFASFNSTQFLVCNLAKLLASGTCEEDDFEILICTEAVERMTVKEFRVFLTEQGETTLASML